MPRFITVPNLLPNSVNLPHDMKPLIKCHSKTGLILSSSVPRSSTSGSPPTEVSLHPECSSVVCFAYRKQISNKTLLLSSLQPNSKVTLALSSSSSLRPCTVRDVSHLSTVWSGPRTVTNLGKTRFPHLTLTCLCDDSLRRASAMLSTE